MADNKNTLLTLLGVFSIVVLVFVVLSTRPKNLDENLDFSKPIDTSAKTQDQAFGETNQDNINLETKTMTNQAPVTDLIIEDIQEGTGPEVKSGDTILIHYKGTLQDGTKFDSSYDRDQPFETQIGVGRVIQGWDQGILGLKAGGKRKLTIPYQLAYGEQGIPGSIPPKATLIFEVELIDVID